MPRPSHQDQPSSGESFWWITAVPPLRKRGIKALAGMAAARLCGRRLTRRLLISFMVRIPHRRLPLKFPTPTLNWIGKEAGGESPAVVAGAVSIC